MFRVFLGTKYYPNEKTSEGICLSLAVNATNEYHVDRVVDELCQKFLTDDNNQPVSLARLYLAEGFDFRVTLLDLINEMPEFISQNVLDFKVRRIAIDELWSHICLFLDELLTVFSHYAAIYDRQEDWLRVLELSEKKACTLFLSGHLEVIHKEWQIFFNAPHTDETENLQAIANEIKEIFRRCGLTLTNVPDGIYVRVDFV